MWEAVIPGPGSGIQLSDVWPLLAIIFAGCAGVFGFMVKHINDLRAENKELRDKLTDQVVPCLTESTLASKAMMEASVKLQAALAVAEDRLQGRRSSR